MKFISEITVRKVQSMGDDATLAAAAKVLEPKAYEEYLQTHEKASVEGLIRYLMQHRHGTPFEHSALSMFVHAPIFVWREWHRHRIGQSYNEESARYKKLEPVFYIPPRYRPMIKVEDWKPGRPKFLTLDQHRDMILKEAEGVSSDERYRMDRFANGMSANRKYEIIIVDMIEGYKEEYARYERRLSRHLDPGLARANLPVGIYSSCWVTANPRSLMHFLSLRTHEPEAKFVSYPLYEIEEAARKVEMLLAAHWPITYKAFCDFGRTAP